MATKNKHFFLPGLYGLRAIAAIVVFVSNMRHIVPMGGKSSIFDFKIFLESGIGVAFFFVLSGYLLTFGFWRDPENWIPFKTPIKFFFTRLLRLLPLYFICLIGLVIYMQHWQSAKEIKDTIFHFLLIHNFFEFSFYSINSPFWTIPIQMQFYLFLPVIMMLAYMTGHTRKKVFVILLFFSVICYSVHYLIAYSAVRLNEWPLNSIYIRPNGFVITKSVIAHLPIFIIGCAGSYLTFLNLKNKKSTSSLKLLKKIIFWSAIFVIFVISATSFESVMSPPYSRYVYPVLPVMIVLSIIYVEESGLLPILEAGVLKYLGLISYGIYIFHMPCIKAVVKCLDFIGISPNENRMILAIVSFLFTIFVSGCCHKYLEKPLFEYIEK